MPVLELDRLYLEPRHLAILQSLLHQQVAHAEVWAYGSRVTGGAHETSDLDLVLYPQSELAGAVLSFESLGVLK